MLVPWAKLIIISEMSMGSVPRNGAWYARASMNLAHNTLPATFSALLIILVQIEELSGEHASEHFAARVAIFSERLEYSLTALI